MTYAKLMKSKRELRDLEKQKERSSAKVGQFLLNLQTLKRQLSSDSVLTQSKRQTPVAWRSPQKSSSKKVHVDLLISPPSSVDRLTPDSKERGCFGSGDPRMVDESGYPLVSIKEAATIVADLRGALTKTTIQRAILQENSSKLKEQQREIDQMERMKQQLFKGRAITNLDLYRSLIFKAPRKETIQNGIKIPKSGRIKIRDVMEIKANESDDFSNLRGQAPVVTRKKELRNIIVPQEEIKKANREFWRHNGSDSESESESELRQLFDEGEDHQVLEDDMEEFDMHSENSKRSPSNRMRNKWNKTPDFLVEMRKRQLERAEKREEIRKLHELKEAEKKRLTFEAETERLKKEQEDKLTKRKKVRALVKQEKLEQKIRTRELERFQFLTRRAKLCNETRLKKRYGLEPWINLVKEKKLNEYLADKHHEKFLLKKCLADWIHMTKSNVIMRRVKAEEFEKQKLLTHSFGKWLDCQINSKLKLQAAFDFNEMRLTSLFFNNWRSLNDKESKKQFKKDLEAIKFHRR